MRVTIGATAALCCAALLLATAHAGAQGLAEGQAIAAGGTGTGVYSSPYAVPWGAYNPITVPAANTAVTKDSKLVVGAPGVASHLQVGGPGVENGVQPTAGKHIPFKGKDLRSHSPGQYLRSYSHSPAAYDDEGVIPRRGGVVGGGRGFVGAGRGFVGGGVARGGVARGTTVVHRGGAVVARPGWRGGYGGYGYGVPYAYGGYGYAEPLYGESAYAEPYAAPVYGAPVPYGGVYGGGGVVAARGGTTVVRRGAIRGGAIRGGGVGFRRGFGAGVGRRGGIGFADLEGLSRAMDAGVASDEGVSAPMAAMTPNDEGIVPRHRGGFIGGGSAHGTTVAHRSGAVVARPGWRAPLHGGGGVVAARGSSTVVRHGAVRGGAAGFRRGFGRPGIGFADIDALGRAMDAGVDAGVHEGVSAPMAATTVDDEGIVPAHRGGFVERDSLRDTTVVRRSGTVVTTPGLREPLHGHGAVMARGSSTVVRHGAGRGDAAGFRRSLRRGGVGSSDSSSDSSILLAADIDALGRAMDEGAPAEASEGIWRGGGWRGGWGGGWGGGWHRPWGGWGGGWYGPGWGGGWGGWGGGWRHGGWGRGWRRW